jgi:hypothetical protein
MKHANFELARIAKEIIANHLKGTHQRLIFGPLLKDEHIEDCGESYDASDDCMIEHMLDAIVPEPQGYKSLRQVLQEALLIVASEHGIRPTKAVDRFLTSLRGRSLQEFMRQPDHDARRPIPSSWGWPAISIVSKDGCAAFGMANGSPRTSQLSLTRLARKIATRGTAAQHQGLRRRQAIL